MPKCRNDVPYAHLAALHRHRTIPLWDARLSKEVLEGRLAKMGSREFDRGYRQRAISEGELLWKEDYINGCLDKEHSLVEAITPDSRFSKMPIYAGVDLAISTENAEAAFFCIMVIAVDAAGHRWILNMFHERNISFGTQVMVIRDFHERYNFNIVKVESNGYQQSIIDHLGDSSSVPVVPQWTGAAQKKDIEIGIPSLAVEWEHHRWHVPQGDAKSIRVMEPLLEEISMYPDSRYTDTIMATFFAREATRKTEALVEPKIFLLRF